MEGRRERFTSGRKLGVAAARIAAGWATRFEALEPLRRGVTERFGGYAPNAAVGLAVRHDHGNQDARDTFQGDLGSWASSRRPRS
jgi:hypothetical protein